MKNTKQNPHVVQARALRQQSQSQAANRHTLPVGGLVTDAGTSNNVVHMERTSTIYAHNADAYGFGEVVARTTTQHNGIHNLFGLDLPRGEYVLRIVTPNRRTEYVSLNLSSPVGFQFIETENQGEIHVYVSNDRVTSLLSQDTLLPRPFMENDRILTPVVAVDEAINFETYFMESRRVNEPSRISLVSESISIEMGIADDEITLRDLSNNTVDSSKFLDGITPRIHDERVFIPIRSVGELAGFNVSLVPAGLDLHAVLTRPLSRFAQRNIQPTDVEFVVSHEAGEVEW